VIVRWGLGSLPGTLDELGVRRPLLVASERWSQRELPIDSHVAWTEVPSDRIGEAAALAAGADGIVPLGGGSAIDLAKAISVETGLPVVSVPTTYSGAEWTPSFGIRDPGRRMKGGGSGAKLAGIVYEPKLMLELPRAETVGTALNALAHAAEALYVEGRNDAADARALEAARGISAYLPRVVADPADLELRTKLLSGAAAAGEALALAGLALGHAIAQALGGRYGLAHGAMNALALPAALRFNSEVAQDALNRFGEAMSVEDPIARVEELARLGGFERLRDFCVPEDELPDVAEAAAARPGARANPRPVTPKDVEELLRGIY
jgi:maleylacetate reductase